MQISEKIDKISEDDGDAEEERGEVCGGGIGVGGERGRVGEEMEERGVVFF